MKTKRLMPVFLGAIALFLTGCMVDGEGPQGSQPQSRAQTDSSVGSTLISVQTPAMVTTARPTITVNGSSSGGSSPTPVLKVKLQGHTDPAPWLPPTGVNPVPSSESRDDIDNAA